MLVSEKRQTVKRVNNCELKSTTMAENRDSTLQGKTTVTGRLPSNEKMNISVSPDFKDFLKGLNIHGDSGNPMNEKPNWLDMEKFKKGQAFFKKYFAGLFFSNLLSFLLSFGIPRLLKVLIYARNVETEQKAFRRYVSTSANVKLWYEGDIWNPSDAAYKSMRTVRAIHNRTSKVANSTRGKEIISDISIRSHSHEEIQPKCPWKSTIILDACKNGVKPIIDLEPKDEETVYVSQFDLSVSQFTLAGMMIVYPEKFGAPYATEEDLEGLAHFWRGCGYQLGIEDRCNIATNGYHGFKSLALSIIEHLIKPELQRVTDDYEHVSRMLIGGLWSVVPILFIQYESLLLYLCWCIGLEVPTLYSKLKWTQWIHFWFLRFIFGILFWIPGAMILPNLVLRVGVWIARYRFPHFVGFKEKYMD